VFFLKPFAEFEICLFSYSLILFFLYDIAESVITI